ncbi:MAG TPA: penicillin-binding transpeptidase domain-containing protein [Bryobacteraceae bacterium]|nr:penicillin-binding transpeptidase domain-containing protein [Bryobacteraceae bacterium]
MESKPFFRAFFHVVVIAVISCLLTGGLFAVTTTATTHKKKKKHTTHTAIQAAAVTPAATGHRARHRRVAYSPWSEPTYADSTVGDNVDGEDLTIRRAAVEALGPFNGSVVVADPGTGRVLTMVNQKLALGSGFQPCSTIKVSVALAALQEKLIERTTKVHLYGRTNMTLTDALAHSNNYYFANLGIRLGYERVNYYARLFGYGETAGLDIPGEKPGFFPAGPPKNGGVGMLTSFGEEISQTPLQLAALMSAIANGGTLYYLQYPRNQEEVDHFVPRIKRQLDIQDLIPEIKPGMQGAVQYGTARRARQDETIMGKTGTCSEGRTHLGWFGSFNDVGPNKLVVVVLLTGGRPSIGPMAAGVAGDVYRRLAQQNYFATNRAANAITPAALVSTQICCAR